MRTYNFYAIGRTNAAIERVELENETDARYYAEALLIGNDWDGVKFYAASDDAPCSDEMEFVYSDEIEVYND